MKIRTTNEHEVEIDDADFERVRDYRWGAYEHGNTMYAVATSNRFKTNDKPMMHRFIVGASAGQIVDHRDGNGLNNRRDNLRVCSIPENNRNKKKFGSRHKLKGVWQNENGTWAAILKGKRIGKYESEEQAALAYDRAAEKEFGEFASLNFPESKESPESLPMRKKSVTRHRKHWDGERPVKPVRPRGRPRKFSGLMCGQLSLI